MMTLPTEQKTFESDAAVQIATPAKGTAALKPAGQSSGTRSAKKSKKDQLTAMIAKPEGVRISVLVERLGWQAHTVRAALSGLRKQGHHILASKSPRTGEAVYRLMTVIQAKNVTPPEEVAS